MNLDGETPVLDDLGSALGFGKVGGGVGPLYEAIRSSSIVVMNLSGPLRWKSSAFLRSHYCQGSFSLTGATHFPKFAVPNLSHCPFESGEPGVRML